MAEHLYSKGYFTLPGEAGCEELTLRLAEKWGADVIRDSDGTQLSDEILKAGYGIYSTICIIRQHNAFAEKHPDTQQQCFLCSEPVLADGETVTIDPLKGYFREQFELNESENALRYWQVTDRTAGCTVDPSLWKLENGRVTVSGCTPWHFYTVSCLVWRIWEEINMYNHTTNHWTSEHLRQLDPRHPEAFSYMCSWLENWCISNPATTVVRFTSLFYNFVWIFGDSDRLRTRFTDWGSYDFTVSPEALDAFREKYGYALTAEDFVNGGKMHVSHMPPNRKKRDYMAFIRAFVAEKARVLVDIVHKYGKKAYVFYDDSWVGMEPYCRECESIGFDGLIKCIFSGFECRLCAGVKVPVHEVRLHPYLFPVGLGGLPTFSEGGHPEKDALLYWKNARRAMLRQKIDRIGLGGYLHLTEGYPAFTDTIERIGQEFRRIRALHENGAPETLPLRVAVLHSWGSMRSWTLSGHFHETYMHDLIHINESLSGLPVQVRFIGFDDVREGALRDFDAVINAGKAGDAWSGGDDWADEKVLTALTSFVYRGGALIGVNEPTAAGGTDSFFRLAGVLGVDLDQGDYVCHGKWQYDVCADAPFPVPEGFGRAKEGLFLKNGSVKVLCEKDGVPTVTVNDFGKGHGIYLSSYENNAENTYMLLKMLLWACGLNENAPYIAGDARTECAFFPKDRTLAVINNSEDTVSTFVTLPDGGKLPVTLEGFEMKEYTL